MKANPESRNILASLSGMCVAIFLLVGVASSAQGEPVFEISHIVKKPKGFPCRGMNGDLLSMKDGSLLFCYTERSRDGGIMTMRSRDQGRSWSEPTCLLPQPQPPAEGLYVHPSLLRVADDEILLAYNYTTHPRKPYYAKGFYRRSADEGRSWSDQFLMTPYPGYTLVHNDKLLALKDGRILAVAAQKAYLPGSQDHSGFVGMVFYSDDNGHSWQPSRNTVDLYSRKIEVQEPDVVELKDGRLLMFARTYSGFPVFAFSSDRGESWSEGQPVPQLKMPYAGLPTVRRIPATGDLLFIWISEASEIEKDGKKLRRRCTLTTAISQDEGKTFVHQRNIVRDPANDFGYQCIEFIADDLALVAYHADDGIHLARIGVDWFYGR